MQSAGFLFLLLLVLTNPAATCQAKASAGPSIDAEVSLNTGLNKQVDSENDEIADAVVNQLRKKTAPLCGGESILSSGIPIAAPALLCSFYQRRSFTPAWTNTRAKQEMFQAIEESKNEGLDPNDYHHQSLERLLANVDRTSGPELTAELDILLSDALVRLGYHLDFGKVDPVDLDPHWNIQKEIQLKGQHPADIVQQAIASPSLKAFIDDLKPKAAIYINTRNALATYRDIQQKGGWQPIAEGPVLEQGVQDPRVKILRQRLAVTNDLTDAASLSSETFDAQVDQAVKGFQRRHNLPVDGAVGPLTLKALNIPVEKRIEQIRVNLERLRWVVQEPVDTFIIVNIAGFELYFVKDNKLAWRAPVQVGTRYRQTPAFKSDMTYLVINPTWTVPPTILDEDMLPKIKHDPGYLVRKNLSVWDRDGRKIDPATIDWNKYNGLNFPYRLQQEPGSDNALGRIKFIFPNKHFVFLHDTPHKTLFKHTQRTFSSGCIRVARPFELAQMILADSREWSRTRLTAVTESHKTTTIQLSRPLPVYLLYWTAFPNLKGSFHFREDIYDRDGRVLQALNDKFRISKRHVDTIKESIQGGRP